MVIHLELKSLLSQEGIQTPEWASKFAPCLQMVVEQLVSEEAQSVFLVTHKG